MHTTRNILRRSGLIPPPKFQAKSVCLATLALLCIAACIPSISVAQSGGFGGLGSRISNAMRSSMPKPPMMSPSRQGPMMGPPPMMTPGRMMTPPSIPFGSPMSGPFGNRVTPTHSGGNTNRIGIGNRITRGGPSNMNSAPTRTIQTQPMIVHSPAVPTVSQSLGQQVGTAVVDAAMSTLATQHPQFNKPEPRCCSPENPFHRPSQQNAPTPTMAPSLPVAVLNPHSSSPTIVTTTQVTPADTIVAGIPSAPAASQSAEQRQAQLIRKAVEEGKALFRAGRYMECVSTIDQALALMPEDPDLLQFRGFAYFANGDTEESAADIYDALLSGNTWNWEAVYDLYQSKDKYELHLRRLEQQRAAAPSMSTHFALGYQYLVLNHLARGKKELEKALIFQPEEPLMTQLVNVVTQMVEAQ